jgi:multisubunit Na+/H+ antiporter MnhG subunit
MRKNLFKKSVQRAADMFEQDSRLWGLSLREALVIAAMPIIVTLGMIALVRVPDLFVWLTAEDSVMEWLQFVLIFASSLIFARLSLHLYQTHQVRNAFLCLVFALGTFFVAGEEIAWGQHIFGWSTPGALEAVNVQQETTLHNISSAHSIFVYGVMLAGLYGVLAPLLNANRSNQNRPSGLRFLLIPPLCLVPAFFMPFGYRFSRLAFGVDTLFPRLIFPITKFSEVTELCLYFGVAVFAWLNLRKQESMIPASVRSRVSENTSNLNEKKLL